MNYVFKMPLVILYLLLRHHKLFFRVSEYVKEVVFKALVILVYMCLSQTQKLDLQMLNFTASEAASISERIELVGIWLGPVFGPLGCVQLCKQTYFYEVCD